jgi:ABC-type microcin C transport system permease subunit YejB
MNIWAYILKRVLLMLPTLFGVVAITFAVIQFVPGGPVEQALSELKGRSSGGETSGGGASQYRGRQGIDAERVAEIKALYGFDKPPIERFGQMLKGFATFDLGKSFYHRKSLRTIGDMAGDGRLAGAGVRKCLCASVQRRQGQGADHGRAGKIHDPAGTA